MKIAKLKKLPSFQEEGMEPELAKFSIEECEHEKRKCVFNYRLSNKPIEICKDCDEITRFFVNSFGSILKS